MLTWKICCKSSRKASLSTGVSVCIYDVKYVCFNVFTVDKRDFTVNFHYLENGKYREEEINVMNMVLY